MSAFVLVHGAFQGGWVYTRVARMLRKAGHEVYTPTLTGLGGAPPSGKHGDQPRYAY